MKPPPPEFNLSPIDELEKGALEMVVPLISLASAELSMATLRMAHARHHHTDGVSGYILLVRLLCKFYAYFKRKS